MLRLRKNNVLRTRIDSEFCFRVDPILFSKFRRVSAAREKMKSSTAESQSRHVFICEYMARLLF